jgi:hypothetical protein
MSSIGYRQKGENGPLYNPERDYAYITPTLMVRAIENLDESARTPEAADWYVTHAISQDEIVAIAAALAAAQRDFVNASDPVDSFEQALRRRNVDEFRYPVRQALFAAIGEVFCAAWFKAVREVSNIGEESPAQFSMTRFASAVAAFATRAGAPTYNADHLAERLRFQNDVLQTRLNIVYAELQKARAELEKLSTPPPVCAKKAEPKSWWQRLFAPTDRTGPK